MRIADGSSGDTIESRLHADLGHPAVWQAVRAYAALPSMLLMAYARLQTSDGDTVRIGRHLSRCAMCRATLDVIDDELVDECMVAADATWDGISARPARVEDPTGPHLVGRVIGDRYRVEEELSGSRSGRVFRGVHVGIGRWVDLGFLVAYAARDPQAVARFHDIMMQASRIHSSNVAPIYDFGYDERTDLLWFASAAWPARGQAPVASDASPWQASVLAAMQVCDELIEAHHLKVVHGCLNSETVTWKVTERGPQLWITGFGVEAFRDGQPSSLMVSLPWDRPLPEDISHYAPEQIPGGSLDPRTDLYQLGVLLYTWLAGRPPFEGGTPMQIAMRILDEVPPPPSAHRTEPMPAALDAIVLRLLAKNKHERFPSAAALRTALVAVMREATADHPSVIDALDPSITEPPYPPYQRPVFSLAASSDAPVEPIASRPPRWWRPVPLIIALVLLLFGLGVWWLVHGDEAEEGPRPEVSEPGTLPRSTGVDSQQLPPLPPPPPGDAGDLPLDDEDMEDPRIRRQTPRSPPRPPDDLPGKLPEPAR